MQSQPAYNMKFMWMICLIAAMGGFLFGYDFLVVGGAKPFYEPYFRIVGNLTLEGWGTSSALTGCILGAVLCGMLCDKLGRKRLLIAASLLLTAAAVGTALAGNFWWYNFSRIVGGVGMGFALELAPMYIAEMAPAEKRGMFVSVNQLTIMIGVLSAQVINWLISLHDKQIPDDATAQMILQNWPDSWNVLYGWRWMFGAMVVPAFLFFLLMLFVPESVRWLIKNGRDERAGRVLEKIGGSAYATKELADIKATISAEEVATVHFRDLLDPKMLKILFIGVCLALLQQWCGMNVIFYYAADIFTAAGYGIKQTMLNIAVIGLTMVVFCVVALFTVDRVGRKKLMLLGTAALTIIYGLIGYCFKAHITGLSVVLLVLANVAFYSFTLAPVTWVLLSEIFPNRIRGAAMSISVLALWLGNFSLTFFFPSIQANMGTAQTFWLYGGICAVGFLFILLMIPKTEGKTLEQIERELVD